MIDSALISPALAPIAKHWQTIRSELNALRSPQFIPWPETFLYDNSWTVFGLVHNAKAMPLGIALCPKTYALLKDIPDLLTAGFSKLSPKTTIFPHRGNNIPPRYRCHLGMIVPQHCCFTVVGQDYSWKEREWLCFDDAEEHSATNQSDEDRIVLLIDILKK